MECGITSLPAYCSFYLIPIADRVSAVSAVSLSGDGLVRRQGVAGSPQPWPWTEPKHASHGWLVLVLMLFSIRLSIKVDGTAVVKWRIPDAPYRGRSEMKLVAGPDTRYIQHQQSEGDYAGVQYTPPGTLKY